MSRVEIGAAVLNVPDGVTRGCTVTDFAGVSHEGVETPALVSGPGGVLLEIAHRRWGGGGQVVTLSRGNSSPAFDRLIHGSRLGVQERSDGSDSSEIGLLRWDPSSGESGWGNPSKASVGELDALLDGSSEALFVRWGCYDVGPRELVLGDESRRKNWLCATYPAEDAFVPLAIYALTRVLPIIRAQEAQK